MSLHHWKQVSYGGYWPGSKAKRQSECSEIIGMLSITTTVVALDLELLRNIIAD